MASNGQGPEQAPAARRSALRVRIGVAALIVVGIGGLVVAALIGSGGDDTGAAVTSSPAVNGVFPQPGDEALQQQQVGVVLDARYRLASLVVYPGEQATGGVDVTAQVNHIEGLNRFEFAPGEGRLIEALSPDTNCAVATVTLIARPEESETVRWCFEVS